MGCAGAGMNIDDFGVRAVDVSFTNIRATLVGGRRAEILWNDVPLNGGAFSVADL